MNPLLSKSDYARLVGILSAVVKATGAEPARACVSFAVAGAWALRQAYGLHAVPMAGAAFYRVDDNTGFTVAYGHYLNGQVISNEQAFHCWIECEGLVIDLTAPLMAENLALSGRTEVVPRRMFQRPLAEMAKSPLSLEKEGDFFLQPDLVLSPWLLSNYLTDPTYVQLAQVCADWFEQSCRQKMERFRIPDANGGREITLESIAIEGHW